MGFVTDSAMLIQYGKKDTLYLHADTLQSMPDTSALKNQTIHDISAVKNQKIKSLKDTSNLKKQAVIDTSALKKQKIRS